MPLTLPAWSKVGGLTASWPWLEAPGSAPIPWALSVSLSRLLALPLALLFSRQTYAGCFPAPWGTKFLGNQVLLSLGPGLCFSTSESLQELPLDSAHSQLLTSSHLHSGILAGFNPFMAKPLTIPCHSFSTPKGSVSPLTFLSSKLLAVWFSNFVFKSQNTVQIP